MRVAPIKWQAEWIWDAYRRETPNTLLFFKKVVDLPAEVQSASIQISCSGSYKLYINSTYIGRGPYPADPAWQSYDSYELDATPFVPGVNLITVKAYNYGVGTHSRPWVAGGLILQGEITTHRGLTFAVTTDTSWCVKYPSGWMQGTTQMFWTTGFQEIVDLRQDRDLLHALPKPNRGWQKAVSYGKPPVEPWKRLIPREIPYLEETLVEPQNVVDVGRLQEPTQMPHPLTLGIWMQSEKTISDKNVFSGGTILPPGPDESGTFLLYDFGREIVGYPDIVLQTDGKAIVDIGYSECLTEEGRVFPTRQGIDQTDRLIIGPGTNHWEAMGRRAFRYLQICIRKTANPVTIDRLCVRATKYPVNDQSVFQSDDPVLNEVYSVSKYTLNLGMQDHFEDCPLREQAQYVGDTRVTSLYNYMTFGDQLLPAKAIRQFGRSQYVSGRIPSIAPGGTNHNIIDYSLLWVTLLYEYWFYTGRKELLQEMYPHVVTLLEWLQLESDADGFLVTEGKAGWWMFIDWGHLPHTGIITAVQCLYYQALFQAGIIAEQIGRHYEAQSWNERAEKLRQAIRSRMRTSEGLFTDRIGTECCGLHANILAGVCNVVTGEERRRLAEVLSTWDDRFLTAHTGYFNFFVLQFLFENGHADRALKLLTQFWGKMLENGATTWWERYEPGFDPTVNSTVSLCHPWSSGPAYLIPAYILGVRPATPGFGKIYFSPYLGDLHEAEGRIPTPHGLIRVKLQRAGNEVQSELELPPGIEVIPSEIV